MRKSIALLSISIMLLSCRDDQAVTATSDTVDKEYLTPFENGNGNQTTTYEECIAFYENLAADFSSVSIEEVGMTDSGKPLHVIHFSKSSIDWKDPNEDRIKILINNGIHPGESDGIDATMMLMRDLATGVIEVSDKLIFSAIAIYNVGGSLNRNSTSRTNQNGPEAYGFRGNSRNYDLNRDFIKMDTRNARSFAQVYHQIKPDLFIDNHVSNGADYQYTLTHLFTQHNRMGGATGTYIHDVLQPALEKNLSDRDLDITPYVNVYGQSPDKGFSQFPDEPRYSTGYTALWNTLGMMVETHMLKPYNDRVQGARAIMEEIINIGQAQLEQIKEVRKQSFDYQQSREYFPLTYEIDKQRADTLDFKGYEARQDPNELTGNKLMTYNREKPFNKKTPFYTYFNVKDSVAIPDFYVIPQGQWEILDMLRLNNVIMEPLSKDSTMTVTAYKIEEYDTARNAYEGHYPHSNVKVAGEVVELRFRESDILIPTNQPGIKYVMETLEPAAPDSFFKWNFFDTILQQKEGFSPYVFEKSARELLADAPELRREFDSLKRTNKAFKNSNYAQLDWLHKRSPNYETAHLRYPIYKYRAAN
ncbi:M14 family metallopeptidase [Nonlabens ponticola]|uniref:Uncharacterized protein n=1 Tax=Nonlabens ponticola TaxID=2496866 RepID=A0A3S9N0G4_9FLAO|nr:M14 family metallopeptidase [Nonlabens ponticola]AZQ45025.1 hypothetical protein EJ995_12585 [Nonlabens ponticola]